MSTAIYVHCTFAARYQLNNSFLPLYVVHGREASLQRTYARSRIIRVFLYEIGFTRIRTTRTDVKQRPIVWNRGCVYGRRGSIFSLLAIPRRILDRDCQTIYAVINQTTNNGKASHGRLSHDASPYTKLVFLSSALGTTYSRAHLLRSSHVRFSKPR